MRSPSNWMGVTTQAGEPDLAVPETIYVDTETFVGFGDAPGFKGDTFHHGPFDLSRHEGKPVVINFWFPSCPPCRAEIPNFEHAYQTWGANLARIRSYSSVSKQSVSTPPLTEWSSSAR